MDGMLRTSLEVCAGAGGQALGLEQAGFEHAALLEIDAYACATLRHNRPRWDVLDADLREFDGRPYRGKVGLLAGGVPCPPFSIAGKQLGADDDRDLMPQMVRLAREADPAAVLIENVKGILHERFDTYRTDLRHELQDLGYTVFDWRMLQAANFGVSQLRPRVMLVALKAPFADYFTWPDEDDHIEPRTVGEELVGLMSEGGWKGARAWAERANRIGPTLVGGSKKHGGPDLGPTRAKRAWAELDVDGMGVAYDPPEPDFKGSPKLTVRMTAKLQGFPDDWTIVGSKTQAYRQVGNALPPPLAKVVGRKILDALEAGSQADADVAEVLTA